MLYRLEELFFVNRGRIIWGVLLLRKLESDIAELKRMYVLPSFQGKGIGSQLLQQEFQLAMCCGYKFLRLYTLDYMMPAISLYKKNGFYEIPPYYYNPQQSAIYFEKKLGRSGLGKIEK